LDNFGKGTEGNITRGTIWYVSKENLGKFLDGGEQEGEGEAKS